MSTIVELHEFAGTNKLRYINMDLVREVSPYTLDGDDSTVLVMGYTGSFDHDDIHIAEDIATVLKKTASAKITPLEITTGKGKLTKGPQTNKQSPEVSGL